MLSGGHPGLPVVKHIRGWPWRYRAGQWSKRITCEDLNSKGVGGRPGVILEEE
jgi:hypothetical protein